MTNSFLPLPPVFMYVFVFYLIVAKFICFQFPLLPLFVCNVHVRCVLLWWDNINPLLIDIVKPPTFTKWVIEISVIIFFY